MLVLSRKLGEKIFIGDNICITVVDIDRGKIRLGIEAPRDVPIYRQEPVPPAPLTGGDEMGRDGLPMTESTERRGFQDVLAEGYPAVPSAGMHRLVGQSSVNGDYPDSDELPGSSSLWVGEHHHLNRDEVAKLRDYLTHWLETGRLFDSPIEGG